LIASEERGAWKETGPRRSFASTPSNLTCARGQLGFGDPGVAGAAGAVAVEGATVDAGATATASVAATVDIGAATAGVAVVELTGTSPTICS
jgi:hypothetical protein